MGVPSYFAYLIRNHREMLIKLLNFKKQINNLYFDSNSIIYDGLRFLSKNYEKYKNDTDFEKDLIELVCKHLEKYITEIKPNVETNMSKKYSVLTTESIDEPNSQCQVCYSALHKR